MENIIKAFEKERNKKSLSRTPAKNPKTTKTASTKRKAAKGGSDGKSAIGQVLAIVKRSKKGVDVSTVMKKTGFNDKKVRNILFRLSAADKIKRAARGIYVGG
jgi:hypothetical protein